MIYPVVAALYVATNGTYYGLHDVDPWDEQRDARLYAGPWPVVAHPPCARWCRFAGQIEARGGAKLGDDGGLFAAALEAVRRWGGVLEHPAYSAAWPAHDLLTPPKDGGWVVADWDGGWTCYVEQGRYGHPAKKATWLYAKGIDLPSMIWGYMHDSECPAAGYAGWRDRKAKRSRLKRGNEAERPRLNQKAAAATPPEFRDVLLDMARSAERKPS